MSTKHVIIVAGGSGSRFGSSTPKQFLSLAGKPILLHSIEKFYAYDNSINIVLALPEDAIAEWQNIVAQYNVSIPHTFIAGGKTRFHSVLNALNSIANGQGLVAVHDGVRPLVSIKTIADCFDEAERSGVAIPALPVIDSLRQKYREGSAAVNRDDFFVVQTPQTFQFDILRKSYEQHYCTAFTDDASVAETAGFTVELVTGNIENIKITSPVDLVFAEAIIKKNEEKF